MSIKDGNNEQGATQQQDTSFQQQNAPRSTQQQSAQGQQADQRTFSFGNLRRLTRPAISRRPSSETLNRFNKVFGDKIAEGLDKNYEATLIPVDKEQTPNLSVSLLLIALRSKANPTFGVAYYTMLLEETADIPTNKFENINGTNYEVLKVTGDFCNDTLKQTARAIIERSFPGEDLLNAGAEVIYKDFNLEDKNAVIYFIGNAVFACSTMLETCPKNKDFIDLNLAFASQDTTLVVRTQFGMPTETDASGQPLRSDIVIDFMAQQPQQSQDMGERTSPISHISGFMDIFWDPDGQVQNPYAIQEQNANSFQRYGARFVVTQMESQEILTIPAQLLALLPAISLRENNAWIQAFRPKDFASASGDMHDIGAIGLEVNFDKNPSGVGTRIDTHADKFRPEQLAQLIRATFRQGLTVSMDVPECGSSTWYNEVFPAAAGNGSSSQQANRAIVRAADVLTNGIFSKYFNPNDRVAIDEFNRIHTGKYINNGEVRDIRDIDYLAVLNLIGAQDPTAIALWSDSFVQTSVPLNKRLADRKRVITSLCNNVTFTGFATRVTFTPAFCDALLKASIEAGLMIKQISGYNDMGQFERGRMSSTGSNVLSPEASGLFRGTGFGNQAARQGVGRVSTKW